MNRELFAGIYRKHDQYHTSVIFKSHWCQQSFKIEQEIEQEISYKQIYFYIKRIVLYEKKTPTNKQTTRMNS